MWQEENKKNDSNDDSNYGLTYERKKWVNGKKGENNNSGNGSEFDKSNRVWHIFCNKCCSWNKTYTKGFHGNYKVNALKFPSKLPPTHSYCQMIK